MYDQIFVLVPDTKEDDWLLYVKGVRFENQRCKLDSQHSSRNKRADPLEFIAPIRPLYDFRWTPYREAVVTAEVVRTFQRESVSGVKFIPVRTQTTLGGPYYQELYEMRVVGWGGVASAKSGIQIKEECPFCNRRVFRRYESPAQLFNVCSEAMLPNVQRG
jgi:hypothetical protein